MDSEHCIHEFSPAHWTVTKEHDVCMLCGAPRPADIVIHVANVPSMHPQALQPEGSN